MKIAIEGCAHGELERIYESIALIEQKEEVKVDLLICCGDFQSTRNLDDLQCMAIPQKFHDMCSFYKYYSGEKTAPILTIFIGGNHEASNYLQELSYGGWVAPNIYYLGNAGVINIAGIRIAGISGIYKGHDFNKGHHELPPYTENTKRSVYHIRNLEIFRLRQLTGRIDIFLSHDWPRGVHNYGDAGQLLRHKPFFKEDIESNRLGSPPCEDLLHHLKPSYWFSAHLHTKFAALIHHNNETNVENITESTKFLALDKCLPQRRFLQILEMEHDTKKDIVIEYDLEWLTILHLTNHLMSVKDSMNYMPGKGSPQRWIFTPTSEERELVFNKLSRNLKVPLNFTQTTNAYDPRSPKNKSKTKQPIAQVNSQTLKLCDALNIDDPLSLLLMYNKRNVYRNNTSIYDSNSSCTDISNDFGLSSDFDNATRNKDLKSEEKISVDTDFDISSDLENATKDKDLKSENNEDILSDKKFDVTSDFANATRNNEVINLKSENIEKISVDTDFDTINNESAEKSLLGIEMINEVLTMKNKVQRVSLNLPSPKSVISVNEVIEKSNEVLTNPDLVKIDDKKIVDSSSDGLVGNATRKFKRRNHEMYSDDVC